MESRKRRKSNKGQDMISNLPDFIIGRILSLLPTKDAVRTSVLSKNWTYKWTFITDLHFEDKGRYSNRIVRRNLFLSFVHRVLLYLNSSSIQSFSLTISEKYEPCHVDHWISAVVSRRVKKLCIDSKKEQAFSSHSLMKYKSLEELVLNVYHCEIGFPTFALFSSLTVLNLSGIQFSDISSNKSGKVHLNFPVLRTYKTNNCSWSSSLKYVTLEVPLLEVVSIDDESSYEDFSYPVIKFCASRLTKFTYYGYPLRNPNLFDLSAAHIASADVNFSFKNESLQEIMALSSKILKQFQNVECLQFHKWSDEVMLAKDSLVDLPGFEMLAHLELGKVTGEILVALLLRTPYLKTLVFDELLRLDEEPLNYDGVPDCFLTTLQVVKFGYLDGSEYQLSFAKFVIENAVALKMMSFRPSWELRNSNLEEGRQEAVADTEQAENWFSFAYAQ